MGLRKGGARQLELAVQLSFGTSGSDRKAWLRVEDRASSLQLFDAEIGPEQLMEFMAGGLVRITANMPSSMERIGKRMEHGSVITGEFGYKDEDGVKAYAEAWRLEGGWDTVEWRRTNSATWHITGRRWVAETETNPQ